jgi:hypothetical protein
MIGKIKFEWLYALLTGRRFSLKVDDLSRIYAKLQQDNYIILTYRKTHLSTFFIRLAHYILTKRWATYVHVCANIEETDNEKIKIFESIGIGTRISKFEEVFNCDGVCLLKLPKDNDEFFNELMRNLEKPYDSQFNIEDDNELSCIEYIYDALKEFPDDEERFKKLHYLVTKYKNIDPEMIYESGAFEVELEIRR